MSAELQTLRGRIFFWIGMVVFPVFWVGWMNERQFTKGQIRGACAWTAVYVVAVMVASWVSPAFRDGLSDLQWSYSLIAFQIGAVLWIWLLFRTVKISWDILSLFMGMEIFGMLMSSIQPLWKGLPLHPASLVFILVPAAAHLMVEPMRRYRARLSSHLPWYSMSPNRGTEEHERVDLEEALEIADRYWRRARETFASREEAAVARTFGFGWEDQFIEFCIDGPNDISCSLETRSVNVPWFLRSWLGIRRHEEKLGEREEMMQRIRDLYLCSRDEFRARYRK